MRTICRGNKETRVVINDNPQNEIIFANILSGSIFVLCDRVYLKIGNYADGRDNAVLLEKRKFDKFSMTTKVIQAKEVYIEINI